MFLKGCHVEAFVASFDVVAVFERASRALTAWRSLSKGRQLAVFHRCRYFNDLLPKAAKAATLYSVCIFGLLALFGKIQPRYLFYIFCHNPFCCSAGQCGVDRHQQMTCGHAAFGSQW